MKNRLNIAVCAGLVLAGLSLIPGSKAMADETAGTEAATAVLSVESAVCSGQGLNTEGEQVDTAYDAEKKQVLYFGSGCTVSYTVPELEEAFYDVYLYMGKSTGTRGSTMVTAAVNGEEGYAVPMQIKTCAEDSSDLYELGRFALLNNVSLKKDDVITITGIAGNEARVSRDSDQMIPRMPSVGNIELYPAGSKVAVGYDDVLAGMKIGWMGSSVTYGAAAKGFSMADALEQNHADLKSYKYAISGTTLVDNGASSYVERIRQIDPSIPFDVFIIQLSTNDAMGGLPFGEMGTSMEKESFDVSTIAGAMEYLIAYVKETWDCPVYFYSGTRFDNDAYAAMVDLMLQIKEKWQIGVIDLWNMEDMTELVENDPDAYARLMADAIHPTHEGYEFWWTPKFEEILYTDFTK